MSPDSPAGSAVGTIDVDRDRRAATVTSDEAKTNAEALTRATRGAGYPPSVAGTAR